MLVYDVCMYMQVRMDHYMHVEGRERERERLCKAKESLRELKSYLSLKARFLKKRLRVVLKLRVGQFEQRQGG